MTPPGSHPPDRAAAAIMRGVAVAGLLAALAAFLLFSPTLRFPFLQYDDETSVTGNFHLRPFNAGTLAWQFAHSHAQSYVPLSLVSHAVDMAVWGDRAAGHHFTSVVLHSLNTGLVVFLAFLVLARVVRRREGEADLGSALVGAVVAAFLFGVHPLRVESVAWISDRKDLLAGFFFLLSAIAYVLYALQRGSPSGRRRRTLVTVLVLCAVLAHPAAVVAPLVFLAFDLLIERPEAARLKHLLGEKLPLLLVAAAGCVAAVVAADGGTAHRAVAGMGLFGRFLLPFASMVVSLGRVVVPLDLSPVYDAPSWEALLACGVVGGLATLTALVLLIIRRWSGIACAWIAYVILSLPPAIGAYMGLQPWADRYLYLPSIPLAVLAGGSVAALRARGPAGVRAAGLGVAGLAVAACALLTSRQIPVWSDSVTLWSRAAAISPQSGADVLIPLGISYFRAGKADTAIVLFRRAVSAEPDRVSGYAAMGEAYMVNGDLSAAAEASFAALRLDSLNVEAKMHLADVYVRAGDPDRALEIYRELDGRHGGNPAVKNALGFALMRMGDNAGAEAAYREAMRLAPGMKNPKVNLGMLYQNSGRVAEAAEILETARHLDPDDPGINYHLALALESAGRPAEAEAAYRHALSHQPRYVAAWTNLGNLLARTGRLPEARALYREVTAAIPKSAELPLNLAGIYNALGERDSAMAAIQEAIRRKPDFAQAYYAMGLWYRDDGDTAGARQSFQIAVRYGSREAEAMLPGDSRRTP
jgi:protein O-mannosyl-transferase